MAKNKLYYVYHPTVFPALDYIVVAEDEYEARKLVSKKLPHEWASKLVTEELPYDPEKSGILWENEA